jgi:hypothetical protein
MVAMSVVSWFAWIVGVIIWIAIAFWPARVAGRKGHSFIGFFIFSLVFFPAALIVAYLVQDRRISGPGWRSDRREPGLREAAFDARPETRDRKGGRSGDHRLPAMYRLLVGIAAGGSVGRAGLDSATGGS